MDWQFLNGKKKNLKNRKQRTNVYKRETTRRKNERTEKINGKQMISLFSVHVYFLISSIGFCFSFGYNCYSFPIFQISCRLIFTVEKLSIHGDRKLKFIMKKQERLASKSSNNESEKLYRLSLRIRTIVSNIESSNAKMNTETIDSIDNSLESQLGNGSDDFRGDG